MTMSSVEECNLIIENLDGSVRIYLHKLITQPCPNKFLSEQPFLHQILSCFFFSYFCQEYGGRTLRVNFSDKPKPKDPLYPETEHKLFVGNLSWTVTSESLTQAFQAYGDVVGARVLYDGETGKSRGYGFVCYPTRVELEAALAALNGVVRDFLSSFRCAMHVFMNSMHVADCICVDCSFFRN